MMMCIVEDGGMSMDELIDLLEQLQRYIEQRMAPDL